MLYEYLLLAAITASFISSAASQEIFTDAPKFSLDPSIAQPTSRKPYTWRPRTPTVNPSPFQSDQPTIQEATEVPAIDPVIEPTIIAKTSSEPSSGQSFPPSEYPSSISAAPQPVSRKPYTWRPRSPTVNPTLFQPNSPEPTKVPVFTPVALVEPTVNPSTLPSEIQISLAPISLQPTSRRPYTFRPRSPTVNPTLFQEPTVFPSFIQAVEPEPTVNPSTLPSEIPTSLAPISSLPTSRRPYTFRPRSPTVNPTLFQEPTVFPSFIPAVEPEPTVNPSTLPSEIPTSLAPISSLPTSRRPYTFRPRSPTVNPTQSRIDEPTFYPFSDVPAFSPLVEPTGTPVGAPTGFPSAFPIPVPVTSPIAITPIISPVAAPSPAPFAKPVAAPSNPLIIVVKGPTRTPSVLPPSRRPTFQPSLEPSRPTMSPTREPSRPTLKPTASPSQPTSRPVPTTSSPTYKPTVPIPLRSTKRGMVVNPISGDAIQINCAWYYDYKPVDYWYNRHFPIPYIPMIKDASQIANYPVGERADILFTFNEPDVPTSTAYVPINYLVTSYWPRLVALKPKKIAAPACTKRQLFSWLDQFLAGNGTYRPYVDVINVHWHDSDVNVYLQFLDTVYAKYGKPIWVSEFSFADWLAGKFGRESDFTFEDVVIWFNTALVGMENRPFVHGYAYFSSVDLAAHSFASLFNADRSIRPAGWVYAGLGANHTSTETTRADTSISKSGAGDSISQTVLILIIVFPVLFCVALVYSVYSFGRMRSARKDGSSVDEESENSYSTYS